jgi:hypothetical protein
MHYENMKIKMVSPSNKARSGKDTEKFWKLNDCMINP